MISVTCDDLVGRHSHRCAPKTRSLRRRWACRSLTGPAICPADNRRLARASDPPRWWKLQTSYYFGQLALRMTSFRQQSQALARRIRHQFDYSRQAAVHRRLVPEEQNYRFQRRRAKR
jgi:hypothetical protein